MREDHPSQPNQDMLFDIAESQEGYFTTAQATEAGFARSTHTYHVRMGNWIREHRGIYRLKRFPVMDSGYLVLWSLWSRDRHERPQGVYSHATALHIREISDINPSRLHMTVPPEFRRNSTVPAILVLHKARLSESDIVRERGFKVTTVLRAIFDLATSGEVDRDMIEQTLREGRQRGLVTRKQIEEAVSRTETPSWLKKLMETR